MQNRYWLQLLWSQFLIGMFITSSVEAQEVSFVFDEPKALSGKINSEAPEMMPLFSPDGKSLYFIRAQHPENHGSKNKSQDVWRSDLKQGHWSEPTNDLGPINSKGLNAIAGISRDGKMIYLLDAYGPGGRSREGLTSVAQKGGSWSNPKELELPDLQLLSDFYGFHMCPDDSTLLISMKDPKSLGKEDLYVCTKTAYGTWSNPIHLGDQINTKGYEISPFLSADKKRLFFVSNGHEGLGGADIYFSDRLEESWTKWSKPVNLGAPVNSPGYDGFFRLHPSKDEAIFVSDRKDENLNLFSVSFTIEIKEIEEPEETASSGVLEVDGKPIGSLKLNIFDKNNKVIYTTMTDSTGYFNFDDLINKEGLMVPLNETDSTKLKTSKLMLSKNVGNKSEFLEKEELGLFAYGALTSKSKELDEMEFELDFKTPTADISHIGGDFNYQKLPRANVRLEIRDENSSVLESTVTDEKGKFQFDNFLGKKSYLVSVNEEDEGLAEVYEVYFDASESTSKTLVINKIDKYIFSFKPLPPSKDKIATVGMPEQMETQENPEPEAKFDNKMRLSPGVSTEWVLHYKINTYLLGDNQPNFVVLSKVIRKLKAEPGSAITLQGHTCNLGSNSGNQRLSELRAQNVKNYLIRKGISASRIHIQPVGSAQPVSENNGENNRQHNRRVEIHFSK